MNVLPPVLSQHADELIAALRPFFCAANGQPLWNARPIPPSQARRIATHVQGFMVEARDLPYLGAEIDRRGRFTEETLPAGLKLDDCHGCVWLRDAEAKSVEELVRTYQGGMGAVKLRPIYDAVRSLLPWAEQHAPPPPSLTNPPATLSSGAKQNAGQQTTATPRGRRPKLADPQEDDIRRAYAECRKVKATVERLGLKTFRRVPAHKRVQRIVNADKRAKSRAKRS